MLARIVHPFVPPTVPPTPFLALFATSKMERKRHFWAAFFGLQPCPFNGSFNGRVNTPPAACLVAHERPPCHPAAPLSDALEPPKWGLFRGHTQMVSHHTPRHTAESPITPAVAAFRAVSVRSHVRQKKSRQACRF